MLCYDRAMRRFLLPILLPAATIVVISLAPATALAQPPQADKFGDGGFVYVAPGMGAYTFGDDDAEDFIDLSYQTQAGGGYMIRRGNFMATFGGTGELVIYNFDEPRRVDIDGVLFRLLPEVRLGGGNDWYFIYGNIKPGFALSYVDWDFNDCDDIPGNGKWWKGCDPDDDYDDTDPGFNMGFGGGAAFKIYKGLGVGAEGGFDLAFFPDDEFLEGVWMADFIVYAGWWF